MAIAPTVVMGDTELVNTDPGYTGGTEVLNYTFNNEFYASDIADLAIVDIFDEPTHGFEAQYTDDGIKIIRTQESKASNFLPKFAINFATLENETSKLYKSGFSGVYGFELTFGYGFTVTPKRMDIHFNNKMQTESGIVRGPNNSQDNCIRINTNKNVYYYDKTKNDDYALFNKITNDTYTIRLIFDTTAGKVHVYNVADGEYTFLKTLNYTGDVLSSLTFSPSEYMGKDDYITFKSIKIIEYEKSNAHAGNVALETFANSKPVVADSSNVTENIIFPAEWASYNIKSSKPNVISTNGTVIRGENDEYVILTVSGEVSGIYMTKTLEYTVKKAETVNKAAADLAALDLPASGSVLEQDSITLPEKGLVYDSDLEWTISDEGVIAKNGTITKPASGEVTVTLTVTVTNGTTETKTYIYTVKAAENQGGGSGDEPTTPEFTGGTEIINYTFNNDFYSSDIARLAIAENFNEPLDGFEAQYTNDGIKIVRTQDAAASSFVYKFAINLATAEGRSEENNTELYKVGVSGVYGVEITVVPGLTTSGKRTDFIFNNDMSTKDVFWKGPNNKQSNLLRFYSNPNVSYYETTAEQKAPRFKNFVVGKEYKIRLVFDTINGKVHLYDVNTDGTYSYLATKTFTGTTLSSVTWAPNMYIPKGEYVLFKNFKVIEYEKDDEYSGNVAFENFKSVMPDKLVADHTNVTESFIIDEAISNAGTVVSLNEDLVKVDGTVTRRFEDTNTGIVVSNTKDKIYFENVYNFTVKASDEVNIKLISQYDFSNMVDADFVSLVNGQLTEDGYKVRNTKETGEIIGLLKTEKTADTHSNTYYYDHYGAYDYEILINPELTTGNAVVELGYYDESTKAFVAAGNVKIYNDKLVFDTHTIVNEPTANNDYKIKLRVDTTRNNMWVWVNGIEASILPSKLKNSIPSLNAYRVTFENATGSDSIVIKEASMISLITSENVNLNSCMDIADSISVYDLLVDSSPDDVYGKIKLPTVNGYEIEWSSNNPLADLGNLYVYKTTDDVVITISAVISSNTNSAVKVLKEYKLKVLGTDNADLLLEGALAKIVPEKYTNQNIDGLITDLELPLYTEEGYSIIWDSLNDTVISDLGKIQDVNISEDTYVEFRATVVSPYGQGSKNIGYTVKKRGGNVECATNDIAEVVDGIVTYTADVSNANGSMYIHDGNDNKILSLSINDSKITFNDGTEYALNNDTFAIRVVMNTNDRKLSVFVDDKLVLDYVRYEEKADGFKEVVNNRLVLSDEKVIFDEYSLFGYNIKLFDYFDNIGEGYINGDVIWTPGSVGGVNVEWTSSDHNVLKDDGTFETPDSITFFTITVKITAGKTDAYYEKVIECAAVPAEGKNAFGGATLITSIREDLHNDKTKAMDNDFSTYFEGSKINDTSYIDIDMGIKKDISAIYLFRDDYDISLKSFDILVSDNGKEWSAPVASVNVTDYKSNYVTFDLQTARYVRLANIVTTDKQIKLYEIKAYVAYSSDDKAYKDIAGLDMPTDYELKQSSITLPTVGPIFGSTLVWESSDPSIISTSGVITRPAADIAKEVVLTVTATCEGKTHVKSFRYYVSGKGTSSSGGAGGSGGGGGGSFGGNIAGVNTGGTSIIASPETNDIIQVPSSDNLKTQFNDVKTNDWYYTYVISLKNKGIIDGYDDGNFYPDNSITREEFLKLLISAAGIEFTDVADGFSDVDESDWFAPYVYTAKELNIVSGIDAENFGVGRPISRQDMSVMIYNLIKMNKDVSESKDEFADDSNIADYAVKAVYTMKTLGILNGYEDGTFNPQGQLTRAEAAKVISLFIMEL